MNTLEYKGYVAEINYSDEDKCFFGKVIGINGLVLFEGQNPEELEAAFKYMMDDYLKDHT